MESFKNMKRLLFLIIICLFLVTGAANAGEIFFDDFESGPSLDWGNQRGSWYQHDGIYDSQFPNNNPLTYSSITAFPNLTDFTVEVDINNAHDGGIFLRSDYNNGLINGVLLVTGGHHSSYNGLYWHIVTNGNAGTGYGKTDVPGLQGSDIHLKIVVEENTYSAYLGDSDTPVTTLVTSVLSSGSVALYDFSSQTFDNVSVSVVPLPGGIYLLGSGLIGLASLRRRKQGNRR